MSSNFRTSWRVNSGGAQNEASDDGRGNVDRKSSRTRRKKQHSAHAVVDNPTSSSQTQTFHQVGLSGSQSVLSAGGTSPSFSQRGPSALQTGAVHKRNTSSSTTFSSQRRPSQSGSRNSWRDHEESARSTESGTRNGPHGRSYQTHPLEFGNVKKMAETSVDLAVIVRKLTEEEHGLKKLLRDNHGNWDLIELVLVVLGSFCERNGPASFPQGFIQMVNILAEGEVFREIPSIILQLPRSRANNLGTPQDRLKRLVHSVSSFITEMLVLAPAFACNCLGQDFFEDLMSLKDVPSIRALNRTDVFQCFQEVNTLHKNLWEQHSKVELKKEESKKKWNSKAYMLDLMSSLDPPDDFRTLSVIPDEEDMRVDVQPFLRPNLERGSYTDVEHYLDVQFRLLREDFFMPLRKGLKDYKMKAERTKHIQRVDNVRLYNDVYIRDPDERSEGVYTLEFSTKGMQRINWEGSKRLLFGSLLLLSVDNFETFILFTVLNRNPQQLARGMLKAKFEGTALPPYARKEKMTMVESSVYFEGYRCVLSALQKISPNHFPLKRYILGQSVQPSVPAYLSNHEGPIYYDLTVIRDPLKKTDSNDSDSENDESQADWRKRLTITAKTLLKHTPILDPFRPDPETLGLDPSQARALYAALTQKLVVIQGPPGTGKTYLGLRIVQALLHNKAYWVGVEKPRPAPILVICYTNHALDQFLEGIMHFTKDIVRVGGQSKCEAVQQFALREWKARAVAMKTRPANIMHWLREERNKRDELKRRLDKRRVCLKTAERQGILCEDTLHVWKVMTDHVYNRLRIFGIANDISSNAVLLYWLGVNSPKTLADVEVAFKTVVANKRKSPTPELDLVDEEGNEEDEWDKEDVDEIEGQRMMEEEDFDAPPFDGRGQDGRKSSAAVPTSNDTDVLFAITTRKLEDELFTLEKAKDQMEDPERNRVNLRMAEIQKQIEAISKLLEILPPVDAKDYEEMVARDFAALPVLNRWKLYSYWKSQMVKALEREITLLETKFRNMDSEVRDIEMIETAEIIRTASVVGITTTGAAKHRGLLEHLKCKIVVVEEAAEVLEAHIITSLSSSCQHLILIGDHQQLRPSTTEFELAKNYHLDVSLFERLINNKMQACVLSVQHRMRPEVARLIVPAIYPHLENHESVTLYPDVPGMVENVFFLTHSELEKGDKSDQESRSHMNPYEAELALALARHLLMQGLKPSQITILTTYSGQLLHFRKIRRLHATLQGVRISVVDNFQGEENDIIILSLVRSNEDANIGFLKTENRICVALSRAKIGFYLIGNMANLQRSKLWDKISKILAGNGQLGTHFSLRCGVHTYVINKANKPLEFPPDGGCFLKCRTAMPCGHVCPRICHVEDREHLKQKCNDPCLRACSVGHPCPKKCFQDCHPCMTQVEKILVPCKHSQLTFCHKDPAEVYCTTQVIKEFPICLHTIQLDCGRDINKEKCPKSCGMLLNCEHICNRICHKRSSHEGMDCRQPCKRKCPEGHACPKMCFEDCGECQVMVIKKLPCGHMKEIPCSMLPKDAYCSFKVDKILSGCDHVVTFDCSKSTDGYECRRPCERLMYPCGHRCKKHCCEKCGRCSVRVDRLLSCGHTANKVECYVDPLTIKCKAPKKVAMPACGHSVEIACSNKPEDVACPVKCDIRLDCGHQCVGKCHVKTDPKHEEYLCQKACARKMANCKVDHKCQKKCHEVCDVCRVEVERVLPCGHKTVAPCGQEDDEIICGKIVEKTIPECGHRLKLECGVQPTRLLCKEQCIRGLSCGHQCRKKCSDPCSAADCKETVPTTTTSYCGHPVRRNCPDAQAYPGRPISPITEEKKVEFLQLCPQPCRSILPCEHPCKGECGACFNGRLHQACKEKCGRTLVCGHSCKVNCASSCPPCKEPCRYKCRHSRCDKMCCEPCSNCLEPCGWRCEHFKCTALCWQSCNRPKCDKPCNQQLPCGHRCVGLCGETCPPLCRVCDREKLVEFVLYGNEEDEDARFVYLEDCGHTIEVEGMDHWMQLDESEDDATSKEIQMKGCPRCKTIILSCYRYGDVIKRNFNDIVKVKRLLLQARPDPKAVADRLTGKVEKLTHLNRNLTIELNHSVSQITSDALETMQRKLTPRRQKGRTDLVPPVFHVDDIFLFEVQLDVMERLLDILKNAPGVGASSTATNNLAYSPPMTVRMKPALLSNVLNHAERILKSILNRERLSAEEQVAFIAEIDRLDLIRAFFILQSVPACSPTNTLVAREYDQIMALLTRNVKKLNDRERADIKSILKAMGQKLRTGLGISDTERQEILRAVGLSQGHWFKCPNGHIYAIGECGGAMEEGRCPECGSRIGGRSHALLGDNRVATEMDGARFGAWSNEANNFRNYELDDFE